MNMLPTLACGPWFNEGGFIGSVALIFLIKPLVYFAFILAFRYRVSRAIPMRIGQAAKLAGIRAIIGLLVIGGATLALLPWARESTFLIGWIIICIERIGAWWYVGSKLARLQGRRLIGWIFSGTLINVWFDVAVAYGLAKGVVPQIIILAGVLAFIAVLFAFGMRTSLRSRFLICRCQQCLYDLTGNLSGRCPECGTLIASSPAPLAAAAQ
jgi:hypothetical protein